MDSHSTPDFESDPFDQQPFDWNLRILTETNESRPCVRNPPHPKRRAHALGRPSMQPIWTLTAGEGQRLEFRGTRAALVVAILMFTAMAIAPAAWASDVQTTVRTQGLEPLGSLGDLGLSEAEGKVPISLEDAIAIALERNLSLDVQRYRRSQAIQGIREAMGIYDLLIDSTLSTSSETSPVSSLLVAADINIFESTSWNTTLSQLTQWGGTAQVAFENSRSEFSDQQRQPNPSFSIDIDLSVSQPLLRNFGREVTEQNLTIARNNDAISREDFQTQVETVVTNVVNGYWQLVESRQQLEVAEESLALAKELHEMNKIQVDVGTMAPLEMVQSEAGVASREGDIIRLQAQVEDNADLLRQLLNLDAGALWDVELIPNTDPEIEHLPIDVQKAASVAMENRPDLRSQKLSIDTLDVRAKVAANQLKPQLDLQARWGLNGIDGEFRDRDGVLLAENDYFDTLDQALDGDFEGWSVALNFSYPLQNRVAKARKAQAELALEEGNFQLRNLEQQVLTEVRQAARGVETAAKQIESAQVSSKLQAKNLEAEQKRYENGLSTSFQVLEIQEDLSAARSNEVSAIISYRRALVTYQQAIGRLLDEHEIELLDE